MTLYSTAAQFVGDLCTNPDNMDLLFDRRKFLVDVLGDVGCSIIPQLEIDTDNIEVNKLSLRAHRLFVQVIRVRLLRECSMKSTVL